MSLTINEIQQLCLETPAFLYDEAAILERLYSLEKLSSATGCRVLFSIKAFSMADALRLMIPMLDGLAVSSLFEASLARNLIGRSKKTIHITTPALRSDEINELSKICDYVSFNSLNQWKTLSDQWSDDASCGLRVNPQLSYVVDERYDPCCSHSKLGIPLPQLVEFVASHARSIPRLEGLHFHTNCESTCFEPLLATTECVRTHLGSLLRQIKWINLGGGYQYGNIDTVEPFYRAVDLLKRESSLEVFIEPGEAIVGNAGYIVSSVLDLFESDGKSIAVLDTTVNHLPGVFNYQTAPSVLNSVTSGDHRYVLAGATCLAGDLFGEHIFSEPLKVGSTIIFQDVGGYSLVKANMFNGVNLPNIYAIDENKRLWLKKRYMVTDFLSKWESTQ